LDVDLTKMIRQSLWLVAVAVVFTLAIADSRSQNDDNLNTQQLVKDILKTRILREAKDGKKAQKATEKRNKGKKKETKSRSKKKLRTQKKKKSNRNQKKGEKDKQRKIKERKKKKKDVDGLRKKKKSGKDRKKTKTDASQNKKKKGKSGKEARKKNNGSKSQKMKKKKLQKRKKKLQRKNGKGKKKKNLKNKMQNRNRNKKDKDTEKKNKKNSKKQQNKDKKKKKKDRKRNKKKKKDRKRNKKEKKDRKRNKKKSKENKKKKDKKTKNKNNPYFRQSNSTCKQSEVSTTCIESAVTVMNFLQKQVTYFINQFQRIKSFNKTINGKLGKNEAFVNASKYVLSSLGGDINNVSCGDTGSNNKTEANIGKDMYTELNNCSAAIKDQCSIPSDMIPDDVISNFEGYCDKRYKEAKEKAEECRTKYTNDGAAACECWDNVATHLKDTKDSGNCDAVEYAKKIKKFKNQCISKFSSCRKQEDAAVQLVYTCGDGEIEEDPAKSSSFVI